jgi:hypothetical protein
MIKVARRNLPWQAAQFRRRVFADDEIRAPLRGWLIVVMRTLCLCRGQITGTTRTRCFPPAAVPRRNGTSTGTCPLISRPACPVRGRRRSGRTRCRTRRYPRFPAGRPDNRGASETGRESTILDGVVAVGLRVGRDLWCEKAEAAHVVQQAVEHADAAGRHSAGVSRRRQAVLGDHSWLFCAIQPSGRRTQIRPNIRRSVRISQR